jgi:hypothetical protein
VCLCVDTSIKRERERERERERNKEGEKERAKKFVALQYPFIIFHFSIQMMKNCNVKQILLSFMASI